MLDSFFLLRAMNGIREEQLLAAQDLLSSPEDKPQLHFRRKLWSTLLVAAIILSLLGATAYAFGLFRMRVQELEADPSKAGNYWTLQDENGNELSIRLGDKLLYGLSFSFGGDTAPHKVEFRPRWLPEDTKNSWAAQGSAWYDYLIDDREQETDWYPAEGVFDAAIPYLITVEYAYNDHVLVLNGDCEIVKQEQWDGFEVYEINCAKDIWEGNGTPEGRHLVSYENYVLLFSLEEGYMINVGGTLDLETLEHIARELEIRPTDQLVQGSSDFVAEIINIARG